MVQMIKSVFADRKRLWVGFWQLADPKIWVASSIPMLLAICISLSSQSPNSKNFSILWCLLAICGVYLIEIGKNALNESIDYISGVDRFVDDEHKTGFSGGKKTIVEGKLTVNESWVIGAGTLLAAAGIGLIFVFFRSFDIFWIGILGMFFAVFYSLPPFKFCYVGIGEFAVGFTFGPLIVLGMYNAMTLSLSLYPFIASLALCFFIANILCINEFPDYEADKQGGKKNLVVRIGKKKALIVYALLFVLAYLSILATAIFIKSLWWLLPLLTIPFAVKATKNANNYYDEIPKLITSNGLTIFTTALTGVLMSLAALLS